jgi:GxxExxY protein
VEYKGTRFDAGYRADLIFEDRVLVELKSVERLNPLHTAQVLTCLKLARLRTGLLDFNERTLANGVRRTSL